VSIGHLGNGVTACRRLGLPKGASLHVLRHSHASLLLANGVDLATVSERLGHSSVHTPNDIYSHAIPGKDQEAAEMWDKIMQPAPRGEQIQSGELRIDIERPHNPEQIISGRIFRGPRRSGRSGEWDPLLRAGRFSAT
jgi:hypothetical protein